MGGLRQTLRLLRRDMSFTAMAVVMLVLGIGSATAMFSVVDTVLLTSSYPDAERLYAVETLVPDLAERHAAEAFPVNAKHLASWRAGCGSCESVGLARGSGGANLTGEGAPERVDILGVSYDFLPTLGVTPIAGRALTAADDEPGAPRVLLLSESFWRRRFEADPAVVGSEIPLNGERRRVVGVLPASFDGLAGRYLSAFGMFPRDYDAVAPMRIRYEAVRGAGNFNFGAVLRLRPGASPERAADEMNAAIAHYVEEFDRPMAVRLRPLDEAVVGEAAGRLWLLLAAVGALVAIVCVNVAALLVVRAERRRREASVRRALGASTGRLVRQALREGVVLASLGGAAGLLFAYWAIDGIALLAPADTPRISGVALDGTAAAFAVGLTLLTGLLAAALPAWQFARAPIEPALREHQTASTASVGRGRTRELLIAGEVALSAALLIVATLAGAGFYRLLAADRGFVTENVVSFNIALPPGDYPFDSERRGRFHEELLERLDQLPGVQSAGLTTKIPLEGSDWMDTIRPADREMREEDQLATEFRFVTEGYWRAMGVPLLSGRYLEPRDRGRDVAVISESVARKLWPGESALGRSIRGGPRSENPREVIGVVADVATVGLDVERSNIAYVSYWSLPLDVVTYAVRTSGDPTLLTRAMTEAVWAVDPALPVTDVRTMREVVAASVAQQRFQTVLAGLFAGAALLLAASGIYGVVAYVVTRRRSEIGLRMALGANRGDVVGMVIRQGMRPVYLGLVAGGAAAAAAARVLDSLFFAVDPLDPAAYGCAALLLLAAALAACLLPARRAAAIAPSEALRSD